ncbi:MAG: GNAT family N-acetyltransferase [Pirellulales bacterium]|nr:GNAT family N-acetyltransferase [Pirellulales bacterium]
MSHLSYGSPMTTAHQHSARLAIIPATAEHLERLIEGEAAFHAAFGWRVVDDYNEFPEALVFSLNHLKARQVEARWWTQLFILTETAELVGLGGYKGAPVEGVVEIGYAIAPQYREQGLATEAARVLIARAFAEPVVSRVIAHTLAEPNASNRLLQRCGLKLAGEIVDPDDGPIWRWEIDRAAYNGLTPTPGRKAK